MKLQDFVFIIVFLLLLLFKRSPKLLIMIGLIALVLSIPLFGKWIFFTAERLTWYAAVFFLATIIIHLYTKD